MILSVVCHNIFFIVNFIRRFFFFLQHPLGCWILTWKWGENFRQLMLGFFFKEDYYKCVYFKYSLLELLFSSPGRECLITKKCLAIWLSGLTLNSLTLSSLQFHCILTLPGVNVDPSWGPSPSQYCRHWDTSFKSQGHLHFWPRG